MNKNEFLKDMNVLEKINSKLNEFSKTHKKIAAYILNNHDKVVFFTSSKLAKACNVSESSVVRFAIFLGYNGYTDFQKDLQNYLKEKITITQRLTSITNTDSDEIEILYDVLTKSVNDINWLIKNINEDSFIKTVHLISNARNVYLVGSRNSFSVTLFMSFGLGWIRDNVYLINETNENFDKLSEINSEDVILSVSLPRYLKSTIKIHKYAYEKKAHTICITDTINSPLVKYSTIPILINNEMLSFSDNLIPVMCIVTGILNAVAMVNKKASESKIKNFEKFWNKLDLYEKF